MKTSTAKILFSSLSTAPNFKNNNQKNLQPTKKQNTENPHNFFPLICYSTFFMNLKSHEHGIEVFQWALAH